MRVSTGYHAHGHGHGHGHTHAGHYGVPAQSPYAAMGHSGSSFARPLSMRAPVLAPAGFNHQHTGQHQHGRTQNHRPNVNINHQSHAQLPHQHQSLAMADSAYMASEDEIAHLQKLSSEYEPEATVCLLR